MERHAETALEHIVSIVHVSEGVVVGHAAVFLEAEHVVFPFNEAVKRIHELAIAVALAVGSAAVILQAFGSPNGVNLLAVAVHKHALGIGAKLVHLVVRLVGRKDTVYLTVDEVYLNRGGKCLDALVLCAAAGSVDHVSKAVVVERIVYRVQTVAERIVKQLRVAAVEVAAVFTFVPSHNFKTQRHTRGQTAHSHGLRALRNVDTRGVVKLVVEFAGRVPFGRKHLRRKAQGIVGNAVFALVRAVEELLCKVLDERVVHVVDVGLRHLGLELREGIVGKEAEQSFALARLAHELHFSARGVAA